MSKTSIFEKTATVKFNDGVSKISVNLLTNSPVFRDCIADSGNLSEITVPFDVDVFDRLMSIVTCYKSVAEEEMQKLTYEQFFEYWDPIFDLFDFLGMSTQQYMNIGRAFADITLNCENRVRKLDMGGDYRLFKEFVVSTGKLMEKVTYRRGINYSLLTANFIYDSHENSKPMPKLEDAL